MKRTHLVLALTALFASACSGGSGGGESTNSRVAGHWQYQTGVLVPGADLGILTWLDIDKSGAASVFSKAPLHGTLGCAAAVVAVLNDTVLSISTPSVYGNGGTVTYFVYAVAGDTLTLTDADQNVTTFTKAASIPAADQCTPLTGIVETVLPSAAQASQRTSMSSTGGNLVFTNEAEDSYIYYNPVTSAVSSIPAGGYRYVIANQDGDLWNDCFCGGSTDLQRWTTAGAMVDDFDTGSSPISHPLNIRAGTWDGTRLWVGGGDQNGSGGVIEKLNTNAEPDTLDTFVNVDGDVKGMAFLNGKLYLATNFVGPVLVEIDASTGTALTTYALPSKFQVIGGLAVVGGKLYMLASQDYQKYSIVELDI